MDISGKFRLAERTSHGLIFIEAETEKAGPIIIMYQWHVRFNAYQIQTRWFKKPARVVNQRKKLASRRNEDEVFNTMRIHVRKDHRSLDVYVNEDYFDTIEFEEPFGDIVSAKMELQTPWQGEKYDIRFDDFIIKWDDSEIEQKRAASEKNTGGLLVHYTFDEEGDEVADNSGQMCPGIIVGNPRWVDGIKGSALAFDGVDDYVQIPNPKRLHYVQNGDFTVSAWFRATENTPDKEGYGVVVKPGCDIGLAVDDKDIYRLSRYYHLEEGGDPDKHGVVWLGKGATEINRWHHLTGVVSEDGRKDSLYIDGQLVVEEEHPAYDWALDNAPPWYIGMCDGLHKRWPAYGAVDEVRIYNRALSPDEIKDIYEDLR